MKDLKWNVYIYNEDLDSIEIYNIFNHESFREDIINIYNNTKDNFNTFKSQIKRYIYKNFYTNHATDFKWKIFFLPDGYKYGVHIVNIYDQLTLNEEIFINYIWYNYKENE